MATPTIPSLPTQPSRRRFLQGTAAVVGAGSLLPTWLSRSAGATPLASDEGMVVVLTLRGGNDGLNTLLPLTGPLRSLYDSIRGALGITPGSALAITTDLGLHPKLPKLAARYRAGQVALVDGVGYPSSTLSHFDALPDLWAGTASDDRTTGWLGRYLDDVPNWESGAAGVSVSSSPRLAVIGRRAKVPALSGTVDLWGLGNEAWDVASQDAIRALGATSSGLGAAADRASLVTAQALDSARRVAPFYTGAAGPASAVDRDLQLAARVLNCDVGTRAVAVEMQGWDTHALQDTAHAVLLAQLDAAIERFWSTLAPALRNRVCMVVVSEFGRRPDVNYSRGTDHGTAGVAAVIGPNVKAGVYGAKPSLKTFDANGNLIPTVDFRSLYASVLSGWLDADDQEVLGASYPKLNLFAAGPGVARPA